MRLFIDAHAFRAPQRVSPLLVEDGNDVAYSMDFGDDVEQRESFAYKTLPSIPLDSLNERQSRMSMGERAVQTAHRILGYYRYPSLQALGQPIYPQVMLIFACLFLNKLSKTYGEDHQSNMLLDGSVERLTLPYCERSLVLEAIEGIVDILRKQVEAKCIPEQMCAAAVPGLGSIITESKRQLRRSSSHQKRHSLPTKSPLSLSSSSSTTFGPSSPATAAGAGGGGINFDLQSLDLLSDTRFLSGISNDASLWFGQDWWASGQEEGNVHDSWA
jgi:hypothetical protein